MRGQAVFDFEAELRVVARVTRTLMGRGPTALEQFKEQHGIWTHRASGFAHPWCAMWLPCSPHPPLWYAQKFAGEEPHTIIAEYCRVLEEAGLLVTGKTEREAIRNLCDLAEAQFRAPEFRL